MEIYKDIEGYEGLYQISNEGRVKSIRFGKERLLKPKTERKGYLRVDLSKDGKQKSCLVHRLVAMAFIPNHTNLPQVNHKDEDKTNNRVDNLEWCDCTYNNNYGTAIERKVRKLSQPILCVELNKVFQSANEAARWLNKKSAQAGIWNCLTGKYNSAYGYKWKYVV